MTEYIERFIVAKRAENMSPSTLRAYRADLTDLANFVGPQQCPEHLTREIVRAFLDDLGERGQTKSSMTRKLCAIKSFAHWLIDEHLISDDDFTRISDLRHPKLPQVLPEVPTQEEMQALLTGDFPTAFPERDRLLCELMYGVGLRVSEAAQIKLEDLRPEQNAVLIHGKGGPYGKNAKHRLVPLNPNLEHALLVYLPARTKMLKRLNFETDALFFGLRGLRNSDGRGISVRNVGRMLRHMTAVRGLPTMHPHLLRHACGTHLLDNGCPLDVIKDILGHDNLDITALYAQVSTKLMMKTYNKAHPHGQGR